MYGDVSKGLAETYILQYQVVHSDTPFWILLEVTKHDGCGHARPVLCSLSGL